ncbi:hypothetical protein GUJ93_ZPchr0005g14368 [Zizania palustris]|uniref:Uncharacterized protein n=1 Tax=Zizania palustris TaxID=103762 RepID=A0A8J5VF09_ZIZPA|nr:hypothetical protein GUJ93_ZPchr0005g14368 [Zizania palustris]
MRPSPCDAGKPHLDSIDLIVRSVCDGIGFDPELEVPCGVVRQGGSRCREIGTAQSSQRVTFAPINWNYTGHNRHNKDGFYSLDLPRTIPYLRVSTHMGHLMPNL